MHAFKHFKDVKITMENKGEELVVMAKGSEEAIADLEAKFKAIKELCHGCCCDKDENCC